MNQKNQKSHELLYWENKSEQAVRMGNWYGYKNKKDELKKEKRE